MTLLFSSVLALAAPWNKLTRLEIKETIQVPGAVLPPGNYVVKLADSSSNRHIVQFFNEAQSKIYTTTMTIPNQLMNDEVSGKTQLVFYEARGNAPPALRAWIYPGDTMGREFVYPKSEAQMISKSAGRYVPSMDDDFAKTLRLREDRDEAPEFDRNARIYVWTPTGVEGTTESAWTEHSKMDRQQAWRDQQQTYRRYGQFQQNGVSQNHPHTAPHSANTERQTYVVTGGILLPGNIGQRKSEIQSVMARIEDHGDAFKKEFNKALMSSTVRIGDRDELKRMAGRLEDALDQLEKQYKQDDFKSAHEQLRNALETAESVNRFMLRSEFGSVEPIWSSLRSDLNTLASAHTFPVIQVFTLRPAR